jgi:uncharacterized membrane protein YfcA
MVAKIAIGIIVALIVYSVVVVVYRYSGKMPPQYLWLWLVPAFTAVWTGVWVAVERKFQDRMKKRLEDQKGRGKRRR